MGALKLAAQTRETAGKGSARSLRRDGFVPAVLYSKGAKTLSLTIKTDDVDKLIATGQATTGVLQLEVTGGDDNSPRNVLIKEIQRHPYRDSIYHLDLLEIALDEEISVKVPIQVVGESIGITMGGILEFKRRELEVVCLPANIPDSIVIDISDMDVGDTVHVGSIQAPEGVTILQEVNFTVLTVVGAAAEEVEEVEEELDEEAAEAAEAEGETGADEEKDSGEQEE